MFTFDKTIQIGDYVFSSYHGNNIVFLVKNIERRFLNENDMKYGCYKTNKIGDEINPLIEIEPFTKFDNFDNKKKIRINVKSIDGGFLRKISIEELDKRIELIKNHIDNIEKFKDKL